MTHKYVTQKEVDNYIKNKLGELDLVQFANFFCEGAVATVGNHLFKHMEYDCHLEYDMYDWKHDCGMWKIVNDETEEEVDCAESLWEWCVRQ
jgi:hypothetical protein